MQSSPLLPSASIETPPGSGKLLIVDNYDSNTYNIREVLGRLGYASDVYRNDKISLDDVRAMNPSHIILGPGPGTPENPSDVGICPQVLDYARKNQRALLGICLGQQIMVHEDGGHIVRAPRPMHGKVSRADIDRPSSSAFCAERYQLNFPSLFRTIASSVINVMRYHSLACTLNYHGVYIQTAHKDDIHPTGRYTKQIVMAIQHKKLPHYAVQFHPESLFTEYGDTMLRNFAELNGGARRLEKRANVRVPEGVPQSQFAPLLPSAVGKFLLCLEELEETKNKFECHEFPCDLQPEEVYENLYGTGEDVYCLESLVREGEHARQYSYFGYRPDFVLSACSEKLFVDDVEVSTDGLTPLEVLERVQERLSVSLQEDGVLPGQLLSGGLVGFFSYEAMQYEEPQFPGRTPAHEKTFAFGYFPEGLIYDHASGKYYHYLRGGERRSSFGKDRHYQTILRVLRGVPSSGSGPVIVSLGEEHGKGAFEESVRSVIEEEIESGNAQQVVLSRRKYFEILGGSTAALYRRYRELYPSSNMHAIRIGGMESIGSFPELMLRIQGGAIETIQLAGTARRSGDDENDEAIFRAVIADPKEVAEHRMLVDQARNDVGRSSELGTVFVHPEELLYRKDAGPVMHIASTIRGRLANGVSPVRAHAHIAPMGTVSGAPKVRATQVIHKHEKGRSRGIYAGSIGFFDATGNAEFVIGLRNIVRRGNILSVQAGAGIVYDSVPHNEFEETEAKMKAPLKVLEPFIQQSPSL